MSKDFTRDFHGRQALDDNRKELCRLWKYFFVGKDL